MATDVNIPQEGTDLNESVRKAKEETNEAPVKKGFQLNDKQKAAAIVGTVLLGGTAFVAIDQLEGTPIEPKVPQLPNPDSSAVLNQLSSNNMSGNDSTTVSAPPQVGQLQAVQGGTICPGEEVQIAHTINDEMPFSEAFSTAREEVGPGGIFNWHGNTYNTFIKDEWTKLPLETKQEFLSDIGFKPEVKTETESKEQEQEPEELDYDNVKVTYIDGKLTYVFDTDHDGMADVIVTTDEEDGQTIVMLDEKGDNDIDTGILFDNATMEPIKVTPFNDNFEVSMADIDEINQQIALEEESTIQVDTTAITVDSMAVDSVDETNTEEEIALQEETKESDDYSHDDNVDDMVQ
ncbi:hypothetical protein [Runella sp.]|uniref:hypothetical protein n=1 Tax=Runella sp. TaxID=1960881 RepID=UPI003D12EA79